MKTVAISLLLPLLLAQTKAAPASANLEARQDSTPDIVFEGAAGANFTLSGVPRDNTIFYISMFFSLSNTPTTSLPSMLSFYPYTTAHIFSRY